MRFRIVLICIPLFVSETLVSVVTTILAESARDASLSTPRGWKVPDPWTPRTRPPVFAKPQTVSHSSHTPHRCPIQKNENPEPLRIIQGATQRFCGGGTLYTN